MIVESETHTSAEAPTAPTHREAAGGSLAAAGQTLIGRVRVALGGRDLKAEVAAYRLALKDAAPTQVGIIVDHLLTLAEAGVPNEAYEVIAGVIDRIEPSKRERVLVAGHGHWGRAVTGTAIDVDPAVRKSTAALIGKTCDSTTFGVLRGLISDQDKAVADTAIAALTAIADRANRVPPLDNETRASVERLVMRCVREFDQHRRREALGALLSLCCTPAAIRAAGSELAEWMTDEENPAHMALRGMIRRGEGAAMREAAWVWLGTGEYKAACIERLSIECDEREHERVLVRGHLLLNPMREVALENSIVEIKRGKADGLLLENHTLAALSPTAKSRAAAWIGTIGANRTAEMLEGLLAAESGLARINALREVARRAPGTDLLLDWCFDEDGRVARMAALRAGTPAWREKLGAQTIAHAMGGLARSEHSAVRERASAILSSIDPLSESGAGRVAARRMLRGNRPALVAMLQSRVRSAQIAQRLAAIRLAGHLNLGAEMELELLAIVAQSSEAAANAATDAKAKEIVYAASAAVMVLADLPSPAANLAVHRCLRHPDARVRANALDAMARSARRYGSLTNTQSPIGAAVIEFKNDPNHRIRAGAARAGLAATTRSSTNESSSPLETVMPLLTDSRPMHRISGLWLAERIGGIATTSNGEADTLATAVAEMVRADPELEVKVRARRTASRLLARMRVAFTG